MSKTYSYEESLRTLDDNTWKTLNVEEKIGVLQSVENEMAKRENRLPCEVHSEYLLSPDGYICLGGYSRLSKDITINSEQLESGSKYGDDYKTHLDTVLHEGRHAYQDQAVSGIFQHEDKKELEQWRDNMAEGHNIRCENNPRGYLNQPIERDARAFAEEKSQQIKQEQQQLDSKSTSETKSVNEAKSEYMLQMNRSENKKNDVTAAKAAYLAQQDDYRADSGSSSADERKKRGIKR